MWFSASLVILQGWEKDTGDVGDWEIKMQHRKIQQRTVLDQKILIQRLKFWFKENYGWE